MGETRRIPHLEVQEVERKEPHMGEQRRTDPFVALQASRAAGLESQERRARKAIEEFEAAKQRLFRRDGTKVYGDAEHEERMGRLVEDLAEDVGAQIEKAEADAQGYERESLGLSYQDPTLGLSGSDLERLAASSPLVREDCESMDAHALAERLRAVAAGSDKLAKLLHARYAGSRAAAMNRRMDEAARSGTGRGTGVSVGDSAALRDLRGAVSELAAQLEDADLTKRRGAAEEAAKSSRELARRLISRRSAVDGSDEAARRATRERLQAAF